MYDKMPTPVPTPAKLLRRFLPLVLRFVLLPVYAITTYVFVIAYTRYERRLDPDAVPQYRQQSRPRPPTAFGAPTPLFKVLPQRRGTSLSASQRMHPYLSPRVIASYIRRRPQLKNAPTPSAPPAMSYELFVFLTGTTAGGLGRNLSVSGCVLGRDVYPPSFVGDELIRCALPRPPRPHERVSATLRRDKALHAALAGPVRLRYNHVARVEHGDVKPLPRNMRLHLPATRESASQMRGATAGHMLLRSDERVHPARVETLDESGATPKYRLCLMTQLAPYTELLLRWVQYHRRIGFDHVFVFDNHAPLDLRKEFLHRRDVSVVYWPWQRSQVQAFGFFQIAGRARCQWTFYFDVDEYIMVGLDDARERSATSKGRSPSPVPPLAQYVLRNGRNFGQIRFPYLTMGNSGYLRAPNCPLPEAFVHRDSSERRKATTGKNACDSSCEWVGTTVHACILDKAASLRTQDACSRKSHVFRPQIDRQNAAPRNTNDAAYLVHYKFRSWEETVRKFRTPRASLFSRVGNSSRFHFRDINNPPPLELSMDRLDREKFTGFRTLYRRVMQDPKWRPISTIVRTTEGCEETRELVVRVDDRKDRLLQKKLWATFRKKR